MATTVIFGAERGGDVILCPPGSTMEEVLLEANAKATARNDERSSSSRDDDDDDNHDNNYNVHTSIRGSSNSSLDNSDGSGFSDVTILFEEQDNQQEKDEDDDLTTLVLPRGRSGFRVSNYCSSRSRRQQQSDEDVAVQQVSLPLSVLSLLVWMSLPVFGMAYLVAGLTHD